MSDDHAPVPEGLPAFGGMSAAAIAAGALNVLLLNNLDACNQVRTKPHAGWRRKLNLPSSMSCVKTLSDDAVYLRLLATQRLHASCLGYSAMIIVTAGAERGRLPVSRVPAADRQCQ